MADTASPDNAAAICPAEVLADDVNPYIADPKERQAIHDEIQNSHNGLFTPPGLVNTIEPAGNSGGSNWGAAADRPNDWIFLCPLKG